MKTAKIVSLLMLIIFSIHKYYVYNFNFSPWKGGGFAMYSEPHFNKRVLYSEGVIVSNGKEIKFSHKENEIFPYVFLQDKIKLLPSKKNFQDYVSFVESLGRYKNKSGKLVSFKEKKDPYIKSFKLVLYNRFFDLNENKLKLEKVSEYVYK